MAVGMTWNPVPMFPVRPNPFPVFVVVAFNPDFSAGRVGAYIDGAKGRQESKTQTHQQQFHLHYLLFVSWLMWSEPFPRTPLYIGKAANLNDRNEEVKHFVYTLPGLYFFGCPHFSFDLRMCRGLAAQPARRLDNEGAPASLSGVIIQI
jgi:hypothetical protein